MYLSCRLKQSLKGVTLGTQRSGSECWCIAQPVELVSGQMGAGHYVGVEPYIYIYDVDT